MFSRVGRAVQGRAWYDSYEEQSKAYKQRLARQDMVFMHGRTRRSMVGQDSYAREGMAELGIVKELDTPG